MCLMQTGRRKLGDNVKDYSRLSDEVTDSLLDKEIEKGEITKCFRKLKHSKTVGSEWNSRRIA